MFLLACAAPEKAPAPLYTPEAAGPYTPGVMTYDFADARGKDLRIEVWYPAEAGGEPDPYEELPFVGTAVRYAVPAAGPFPLVAFSHGFGGIRYQSIFLTERLASHGFVVVAPDHVHNTLLDLDDAYTAQVAMERPGDVMYAVDEVLRLSAEGDDHVGGLLEGDTYGMAGHSFGGWTAVAVAGGVADLSVLREFCATDVDDYQLCDVDFPEGARIGEGPDPRAIAALPMAPAGWYSFADFSGAAPTLLWGGTKDVSESPERETIPFYERLPAPRHLALLADAGHYAFSDICLLGAAAESFAPDCAEAEGGYIEIDRAHALIDTVSVAFFKVRLAGDTRYEAWLGAVGPEVDWRQEM